MRDYQPCYKNKYYLPHTLHRRALDIVRDYDRQCEAINDIVYGSSSNDGMPRGTAVGNPTEQKALKVMQCDQDVEAVDKALKEIPEEYRMPIFDNIRYGYKYPDWVMKKDYACERTWSNYRSKFLYLVAKNLNLI